MTFDPSQVSQKLQYAFQPIVNTHSGKTYALEALLRDIENLNLAQIKDAKSLFDLATFNNCLYEFDLELRDKAFKKFSKINIDNLMLFYNLDNRTIYTKSYEKGNTKKLLEKHGIDKKSICYEVSEKGTIEEHNALVDVIKNYKTRDYSIAIDDFGVGISGLSLLYHSKADFVKLDRFFITNINSDKKKRLFCHSIIDMAHTLGMKVIAEGIETKEEYLTCKSIGTDYIQGNFIQEATLDISKIKPHYKKISKLNNFDKRDNDIISISKEHVQYIDPLNINSSLHTLFLYFKQYPNNSFVPIIDDYDKLVGVILEVDIKKISYSKYGLALAQNESYSSNLKKFVKHAICVEDSWGIDKALEIFNQDSNSSGIFVTKNDKYTGFIDLKSLLELSFNRNLEIASNQNPLTKLPGNNRIEQYLTNVLNKKSKMLTHIIYFDFDDFKPFNDYYGFRQGDRAILLFTDILQRFYIKNSFIAHIGGDDFFVGIQNENIEDVYNISKIVLDEFKDSAKNLYTNEDKENGYIITKSRDAKIMKFNLLSCSCAIIEISKHSNKANFDYTISKLKKLSKSSTNPVLGSF